MKTAMQELIEDFTELAKKESDSGFVGRSVLSIIKNKKYLEKEKEQIINCSIITTQDCFKSMMSYMGQEIIFTKEDLENQKKEAEQYYNETFKN